MWPQEVVTAKGDHLEIALNLGRQWMAESTEHWNNLCEQNQPELFEGGAGFVHASHVLWTDKHVAQDFTLNNILVDE